MRDGHAWSGSEWSDAVNASPFKESSMALEQAFGLYEAASCAAAQLLPDVDSVRATLPPSDGSVNDFEKQDSTTQMDRATPAPPLKRSRRSPHTPPELRCPPRRLGWSSNKSFPQKTTHSNVQSESRQTRAQKRSSSEESSILPQHHNAALCVC